MCLIVLWLVWLTSLSAEVQRMVQSYWPDAAKRAAKIGPIWGNGFLIQWMDAEARDVGEVGLVECDEGEVVVNGRYSINRIGHR
jgi:hypothetical protein